MPPRSELLRSTSRRSPVTPRECSSMLLTMLSARLPCSAILSRLPVSISTVSSISARVSSSSVAMPGAALSFSSSSSSIESPAKLLTKFSGFLISCAIPAVSWPSAAIFSRLDQIGLRRLQVAQRPPRRHRARRGSRPRPASAR